MSKEKVLVVEDEGDILELIKYNLEKEGYLVEGHDTGESGLEAAKASQPDLVLLDIMLPGLSGLQVCKELRKNPKTQNIPVILVSAKGDESDIVIGLELGADDYITKPFSPKVLVARSRAVLRRRKEAPKQDDTPIELQGLSIHPGRFEVVANGQAVSLTLSEFKILHLLAKHPGWVFTRSQIVEEIRGDDYPVTERAIDVQVVGIRKKLEVYGSFIETVRGVGYRFKE